MTLYDNIFLVNLSDDNIGVGRGDENNKKRRWWRKERLKHSHSTINFEDKSLEIKVTSTIITEISNSKLIQPLFLT
jgi:hypothetical protein